MKIYNKLAMAFGAMVLLASCSDDNEYTKGEWDAEEGYQDVAFLSSGESVELDPNDPTTVVLDVKRSNTKGACTMPVDVLVNDDDVFEVSDAQFADGDSLGQITINFPKAEIGKQYQLQVTVSDKNFVSSYSDDILFTYNVIRVKWNDVGFYYDEDGTKVEGWAMYTDDYVTTMFGVENVSYPVRVQERADQPGMYRLINIYSDKYPYNEPGDWLTDKDYYIVIDATNPKQVYIPEFCEVGMDWGYGMFGMWSMAGYYLSKGKTVADVKDYFGTYANGAITFPVDALMLSMADYNNGGLYTANNNGLFKLVLNPDEQVYEATLEKDFEWKEVYVGEFKSAQLGTSTGSSLEEGVCVTETDSCGPRFEEEYGKPYRIVAPYADGYDLIFAVKDGKVAVLEDYESQPTGTKALGAAVYAKINAAKSVFEEGKVKLNITFTNEDGSIEYGTSDEVLENISWTPTYVGTYTYSVFFSNEDGSPAYDEGLVLSQCDQNENKWKISHVFIDKEFVFTYDPNSGEVDFEPQSIGYESDYGMVFVENASSEKWVATTEMAPGSFEDAVFTFSNIYTVPEYSSTGYFVFGYETFTITGEYDSANAPVMLRNAKKNLPMKKMFQLSNKK